MHLYNPEVQERCVALGLTTPERIRRSSILFKLVFYLLGGMKYCNQQIILDTMILSRLYTFDPLALLASL